MLQVYDVFDVMHSISFSVDTLFSMIDILVGSPTKRSQQWWKRNSKRDKTVKRDDSAGGAAEPNVHPNASPQPLGVGKWAVRSDQSPFQ